jgi:hypothetical protein
VSLHGTKPTWLALSAMSGLGVQQKLDFDAGRVKADTKHWAATVERSIAFKRASDIDHFGSRLPGKIAHNSRRKSIIAALTTDARSCWVQWPQSASTILPRSRGTLVAKLAITRSIPGNAIIKSRSPTM